VDFLKMGGEGGSVCGRYVARRGVDDLLAEFEAVDLTGDVVLEPDYNVAPTKPVPAVLTRHRPGEKGSPAFRQVRVGLWGLVPSWAPDRSGGARLINARVETVATAPAFRSAVARRRCLIPADGWYEWAPIDGSTRRQPYYLTPQDGTLLAFAGLYELHGVDRLLTTAIVTTEASGALAQVHDRMPLALPRRSWAAWLDPTRADVDDLLATPDADLFAGIQLRPVGAAVGNVANNGPELIAPAMPAAVPQTLF
jgi:putative SOS response-associated peptidase YedK